MRRPHELPTVRSMIVIRLALALALAGLIAPSGASAATTCDLSSGVLDVSLPANGDAARVTVATGIIQVTTGNGSTTVTCTGGSPTTLNTNSISIHNLAGRLDNDVLIINPAGFEPGSVPEAGDDEIEFFVNLNNGGLSDLEVLTEPGGRLEFGTSGINANGGPDEDQPDADIIHNDSSSTLSGSGGPGTDIITAQGGPGSGGPLSRAVLLTGGSGSDVVFGGNGDDRLQGDDGADELRGFGGRDTVTGGPDANTLLAGGEGNDEILPGTAGDPVDGGPGVDVIDHFRSDVGVSVSLEGTNAENLKGSEFSDVLRGDSGPNEITGEFGDDEIDGGGGADDIDASAGSDSVLVRDGVADTALCGAGNDTATADALGVDLLTDCETVLFPAPPDPGGGGGTPGGTPGGGGSGGGVQTPAFGARTLVTLALTARSVPARGPVPVRVANGNGFGVNGSLGGAGLKAKPFAVGAGARRTVRLALPRRVRRALARKGKVKVRLSATVRDPAGNSRRVAKTATLRLRGPKR